MRSPRADGILRQLASLSDPKVVAGMARFGIPSTRAYGVSAPRLRALAKQIGKDHRLAQELWSIGVLEARGLAALVDDPEQVSARQMDRWAKDFDSWAVCDACCWNLFDRTRFAPAKARAWSARKEEFLKRAGFALMAALAAHDKQAPDALFLGFLPLIEGRGADERHLVMKAASWALRQIGKRNRRLHEAVTRTAVDLKKQGSRPARAIASEVLRELGSPGVARRLQGRIRSLPKTINTQRVGTRSRVTKAPRRQKG